MSVGSRTVGLVALGALLSSPASRAADPYAVALAAELNRARAERGLTALERDAALDAVAAQRVNAMESEGWFGLVSPAGRQVEDDLDAARYPFRLVTEKLVRTSAEARALVDEWRLRPGDQAQSLFHPGVTRLGVGVVESASGRIVDLVLVTPMGAVVAAPPPFDLAVQASERAALADAIAAERAAANLRPLRLDPLLEQAADDHARALLAALESGQGTESVALLADRVSELEYQHTVGSRGLTKSYDWFAAREIAASPGGRPLHGEIRGAIVLDARAGDQALATLVAAATEPPLHLDREISRLGIGIATGAPEAGGRIVWVIATRRTR